MRKLAKAEPGSDGLVRKVVLKYKLPNAKTFRLVNRPIHGIAVIVPVEELAQEGESEHKNNRKKEVSLNPNVSEYTPQDKETQL